MYRCINLLCLVSYALSPSLKVNLAISCPFSQITNEHCLLCHASCPGRISKSKRSSSLQMTRRISARARFLPMQSLEPKLNGLKTAWLSHWKRSSYSGWEAGSQRSGMYESGSTQCLGLRNVNHCETETLVCERYKMLASSFLGATG